MFTSFTFLETVLNLLVTHSLEKCIISNRFEMVYHLSDLWYTTRDHASEMSDDTTETEKMEILTILPSPSSSTLSSN